MKTTFRSIVLVGIMAFTLSLPAATTSRPYDIPVQQTELTVKTVGITEIKSNQAKCSFNVQGSPITEKGVCFSNGPSPTISDKKTIAPSNPVNGGISIMSGLKLNTKYYVRA